MASRRRLGAAASAVAAAARSASAWQAATSLELDGDTIAAGAEAIKLAVGVESMGAEGVASGDSYAIALSFATTASVTRRCAQQLESFEVGPDIFRSCIARESSLTAGLIENSPSEGVGGGGGGVKAHRRSFCGVHSPPVAPADHESNSVSCSGTVGL